MKLAIMQPYFLPYIGYYQLISAADVFIVYDNIKYTKKGWINRNRFLLNGSDSVFSLPLKKASDSLDISARELSPDFNRDKLLNQFKGAYGQAHHFSEIYPLLERIVRFETIGLFPFILNSIAETCAYLGVATRVQASSSIDIEHQLRGQDRVIAMCKALGSDTYVNPIGGVDLYSKDVFKSYGVELKFIKSKAFEYAQFRSPFVPWLSIVDVLMFNPLGEVRRQLETGYDLI